LNGGTTYTTSIQQAAFAVDFDEKKFWVGTSPNKQTSPTWYPDQQGYSLEAWDGREMEFLVAPSASSGTPYYHARFSKSDWVWDPNEELPSSNYAEAWEKVSPTSSSPPARDAHAAVFDGSEMTIFGGQDGTSSKNDVWSMDMRLSDYEWKKHNSVGALPSTRNSMQAIAYDSKVIVFGGNTGSGKTNALWTHERDIPCSVYPFLGQCEDISNGMKCPCHPEAVARNGMPVPYVLPLGADAKCSEKESDRSFVLKDGTMVKASSETFYDVPLTIPFDSYPPWSPYRGSIRDSPPL
jgi:hypothetical protein